MQIVYSAFVPQKEWRNGERDYAERGNGEDEETLLRLNAHLLVCHKYRAEIKRIQQYLPKWQPCFNR